MSKQPLQLTIGWFYPDLMNTYGDVGNATVLIKRAKWSGIDVDVRRINPGKVTAQDQSIDLVLMGGAQDRQQQIVGDDLLTHKRQLIETLIHSGTPALLVCGAYQFMGNHYLSADGSIIEGLKIFDLYTEHPGPTADRLVGNIVVESPLFPGTSIVGFENHGGRTYLAKDMQPFATVVNGNGNNGVDQTEGVLFMNAIGTYLHGPLLPKNPQIADWLIAKALEQKYQQPIQLTVPNTQFETDLRSELVHQFNW